jgi:hypothetical protein
LRHNIAPKRTVCKIHIFYWTDKPGHEVLGLFI